MPKLLLKTSIASLVALCAVGCSKPEAPPAGRASATPAEPAPQATNIAALSWLAPGADRVAFLTLRPPRCETPKDMDDIIRGGDMLFSKRELGRIAFESPVLLGGAAARSGLSCASCHINGRSNPDFFVKGVSGGPGTADVTNSILSKTRGNDVFDPKPIPDISLRDGGQIQDRKSQAFRDKVHGLIAQEFDGGEPQAQAFDVVLAYLDGLEPSACAPGAVAEAGEGAPSARADLDAAQIAADAGAFLPDLPPSTRMFWLRVARNRLERVYERMGEAAPQFVRDRLLALSQQLAAAAEMVRAGAAPSAPASADWLDLQLKLDEYKDKSFYNAEMLKAALR